MRLVRAQSGRRRSLVAIDKTCSACGHLTDELALSVRMWTCQGCGTRHDRDVNAAKNILAAGRAVAACGAGVSPQRESSPTGRLAVKQEAQRATAGLSALKGGEDVKGTMLS
jgi:putative transposase